MRRSDYSSSLFPPRFSVTRSLGSRWALLIELRVCRRDKKWRNSTEWTTALSRTEITWTETKAETEVKITGEITGCRNTSEGSRIGESLNIIWRGATRRESDRASVNSSGGYPRSTLAVVRPTTQCSHRDPYTRYPIITYATFLRAWH